MILATLSFPRIPKPGASAFSSVKTVNFSVRRSRICGRIHARIARGESRSDANGNSLTKEKKRSGMIARSSLVIRTPSAANLNIGAAINPAADGLRAK